MNFEIKAGNVADDGDHTLQSSLVRMPRSAAFRITLQLIRRTHLYAGLLLLPWVFLFGVTGFLFNHPSWFSDQRHIDFSESEMRGTSLERLPTPQQMAKSVVAMLNSRFNADYKLTEPESAKLGRGGLSATVEDSDKSRYQLSVFASGRGGVIRSARGGRGGGESQGSGSRGAGSSGGERNGSGPQSKEPRGDTGLGSGRSSTGERSQRLPSDGEEREGSQRRRPSDDSEPRDQGDRSNRPAAARVETRRGTESGHERNSERSERPTNAEPSAPFEVSEGLMLQESPVDLLRDAGSDILQRAGLGEAKLISVQMTTLAFRLQNGSSIWDAEYDAQRGSLTAHSAVANTEPANSLSFRNFLTSLHKTHGYPAEETNARTFWAVLVDIMSGVMVFWGISGVVMWWQIKRTRMLGGVVLAISLAAAVWLGMEMHTAIALR